MFAYFKKLRISRYRSKEHGAAAVEFAIVLPVLVAIVFGIFEFGIAYNNYIALTHAAREGARLAAVGKDIDYITEHVTTIAPSVQIASITVDPSDPSAMIVGQPVIVTVTGEVLQIDIPFAYSGAITLSSTAEMRVETNNPE